MRHRSLLTGACAAFVLLAAVPALAETPPVVVAEAPAAAAQDLNTFTWQDMIALNRLGDPQVSPDGRRVVYSVTATDVAANRRSGALFMMDLQNPGEPVRLAINEGGANTARWGSDGKLYFLSGRSGTSQVWRAAADGTGPVQVTNLPLDVNAYRLSPDAAKVLVSLAVFPDCPDLACTVDRTKAVADDPATGQVYDRMFVRHWDTWADGTQNHLFAVNADGSGAPVMVTRGFDGDTPSKPFGDESEFVFAPDGGSIVFSARVAGQSEPWSTNFDLFRTNGLGGDGTFENQTDANDAWDTGPVFSPDGGTMAWRAMARPGFEADKYAIFLRDMATGQVRQIAANWDRSADTLQWSRDGRTLYTTAGDVGQTRLFAIDVTSGTVVPITGEGHVSAFQQTPSGFVFAQDTLVRPSELFVKTFRGREMPRRITDVNPSLDAETFGEPEQFSFPGWNGETVHGYLVKPVGFDPSKKYPVAFLIHGGPQGSFGNLFHYRWNAQTYAGRGYAVVMIDFHGSTGYGQAFTDSISQHWGDRPLEDLQKGWAYALQSYSFLDGGRACALGGSYGGFMVNWIAGNWKEPWKCLVNHDGIFDSRFMGYSTEELWFSEWENGGTPWTPGTTYSTFNPADHVANWTVPMLVIHGGRDYRVPLEQGIATFTALQRKGVESKLLYFPEENHWVLKPQNSVQWHDEVLGWLDAHTAP